MAATAPPALHIVDADLIAGIAGEIVRPNQGSSKNNRLAKAIRDEHRPLNPYQEWKEDPGRSADLDLDEIARAAHVEKVTGAMVFGDGASAAVIFGTETSAGRPTSGILPYTWLERSRAAYEERVRLEVEAAKAARSRGGSEEFFGEDPRVSVLTRELERARIALADAARPDVMPEPIPGYGQLLSAEVVEAIESTEDPVDREILKRRVREYESGLETPREVIVAATEPSRLVEADPPPEAA